jgi:hypothetical protein
LGVDPYGCVPRTRHGDCRPAAAPALDEPERQGPAHGLRIP